MSNKKKEERLEGSIRIKCPIELVSFVYTKCKQINEVPAYIIGEFMVDKRPGEAFH